MTANYHTHTRRCKHSGEFSDPEFVESAIGNGFEIIGLDAHNPSAFGKKEEIIRAEATLKGLGIPVIQTLSF